jgi:hypothetical protein
MPFPSDTDLAAVWGLDKSHVYALGLYEGEIWCYDGRTWAPMAYNGPHLQDPECIWGTHPSSLFYLDYFGMIAHYDGRTWTAVPHLLGDGAHSIWGLPGGSLVVSGDDGVVVHERR